MSSPLTSNDLTALAIDCLQRAGLDAQMAPTVARTLVEGDLLGHSTHGLGLLVGYCNELLAGSMRGHGRHSVVNSRAACELWDGQRLPGPWLTEQAIARANAMARDYGTGTITIKRSHHIACLAAYLEAPARAGNIVIVQSSDPHVKAVAPHGGITPVMTPNPIAVGIPTSGDPWLIDVSMSVTAMGMTRRLFEAGQRMPEGWAIDAKGEPTVNPSDLWTEPKGALLPLGGLAAGHKGFGLGLMIEALTGGLAGFGRADPSEGWGATVFVQVIDPTAFGGRDAFNAQMDHLARACHLATPRPGIDSVRMPGERGLARKREQLAKGVTLHPSIMPSIESWCQKHAK